MHWFLQNAALSPTLLVHSLPFGNKITYVTAASDKKKTFTDCTGCNKSTASYFLRSRAKNHTVLVLPQGATLHPCTNPQLSPVPMPPTHKLLGSIRQAGDTLPDLHNTGYENQQVPCGPHYLLNLTELDIIYCVNWAVVPSWVIWAYNRLHSASSKQSMKSRVMVTSPWTMCMPRFSQAMLLKAPRHQ